MRSNRSGPVILGILTLHLALNGLFRRHAPYSSGPQTRRMSAVAYNPSMPHAKAHTHTHTQTHTHTHARTGKTTRNRGQNESKTVTSNTPRLTNDWRCFTNVAVTATGSIILRRQCRNFTDTVATHWQDGQKTQMS